MKSTGKNINGKPQLLSAGLKLFLCLHQKMYRSLLLMQGHAWADE